MEATHLIKEKIMDGTVKRVAIKDVLMRQADLENMLEEYYRSNVGKLLIDFCQSMQCQYIHDNQLSIRDGVDKYMESIGAC